MKKAFAALLILSMLLGAVAMAEAGGVAGTWYLVELTTDGQTINPADLGMVVTMELAEDGTVTMSGMGGEEPQTGTWAADGATVTVTIDGDPATFTLEDGKLSGGAEGINMVFSQEMPEVEVFTPGAPVEAAEEDFAGTWNAVKIGLEGQFYDMSILNAEVTAAFEGATVTLNGFLFSDTSMPLTYADGKMSFSGSDETNGIAMGVTATLLEDGMLALELEAGEQGSFVFYMTKAEEAQAAA